MEITEPVNENINDKPKDAPPPKPVSTRLQAVENVEKQEKVEKKPKRRESVSRLVFFNLKGNFPQRDLLGTDLRPNLKIGGERVALLCLLL